MGVRAIRIYSTDRDGSLRVSIFEEETTYSERLRFDVGTEICNILKDHKLLACIHNWNHVEILDDWEPPKPDESGKVVASDPLPEWNEL